jgi:UPF0271 protein
VVANPSLNIDLGELPDEDERLYASAHLAHVACGGHAGDVESMARAVERCIRHGTRLGAHPSFPDREGFGRRTLDLSPDALADAVQAQCAALREAAQAGGATVESVKAHGALYHAANQAPALAQALVRGAVAALGTAFSLVGPARGSLAEAARAAGLRHLREGFADRGMASDGTLLPRGTPGALVTDPAHAAAQARRLLEAGGVDTVCVHGDTPGAVEIARAVRTALDEAAVGLRPFGDGALRFRLAAGVDRGALLDTLRSLQDVQDVVFGEEEGAVYFHPLHPPGGVARAVAGAPVRAPGQGGPARVVRVRYDGPDLAEVAARCGLRPDEVCALHSAPGYQVVSVGFLPGFAYLGELDSRLALPRRASPRPRVPPSSLAIAERRTAVYPFASPGGWHLIGTAVDFQPFDVQRGAALRVGEMVRFEQVGPP